MNIPYRKYTSHVFDSPVVITEGGIFCSYKFMTPTRKAYYWYNELDKTIPVMVKLKKVVMLYIELI